MKWVFWVAVMVIAYAYAGYPMWLWMRAAVAAAASAAQAGSAQVSVVMVVRNEEAVLRNKLRNLLELEYPAERCQIVVVSDGSTDRNRLYFARTGARCPGACGDQPAACGKACGLNDGMHLAMGDVILFTDARQK